MLFAWTAQAILWFQSLATGFSIIPDHFIYTVWILSAVSFGILFLQSKALGRHHRMIGAVALLFTIYLMAKISHGIYSWTHWPSLVIHIGIWGFLALAMLKDSLQQRLAELCILGVATTIIGGVAVLNGVEYYAPHDRDLRGVRIWISEQHDRYMTHSCSDMRSSDYLFATTGELFYPSVSEKHDPVTIEQLQNRMIEIAHFFNPVEAGEFWMWDDYILHDLDFNCRAFVPARTFLERLPLGRSSQIFISGCDEVWADAERERVQFLMEAAWAAPIPESSPLCERIVVLKEKAPFWRIPESYEMVYEGDFAAVFTSGDQAANIPEL